VTSPVLGPGETVLYVATSTALLALDAADGHVLWSAPLAAAPTANPALADGRLYVPIANGQLVVLSTSGAPLWKARWAGTPCSPPSPGAWCSSGPMPATSPPIRRPDAALRPARPCSGATWAPR
jgi:outer membrane protein assembly factor BamB